MQAILLVFGTLVGLSLLTTSIAYIVTGYDEQ